MSRYSSLEIPLITPPFTSNYEEIESLVFTHLNELLDKEQKDSPYPREYFFNKIIVGKINKTISALESKDRQSCPFTRDAKDEYEKAVRMVGEESLGKQLFIEERLPVLEKRHKDRLRYNLKSTYPFPEFIKADAKEIINVILAIKALHSVYDNKDRLGLDYSTDPAPNHTENKSTDTTEKFTKLKSTLLHPEEDFERIISFLEEKDIYGDTVFSNNPGSNKIISELAARLKKGFGYMKNHVSWDDVSEAFKEAYPNVNLEPETIKKKSKCRNEIDNLFPFKRPR